MYDKGRVSCLTATHTALLKLIKLLFLCNIFADIEGDCHDDYDTLYNVLVVCLDTKELHGRFQQLEYQNTYYNT